jgi:chromosome segregation ATPase
MLLMRTSYRVALWLSSPILASLLGAAEPAASGDDRLREALRESTLQLRSAQADLANIQSAQASLADEKKALTDRLEALKKQVIADRAVTDKSAAGLASQLTDQKATNVRLKEALEKSKAEGDKAAEAARVAETANAKLKSEKIFLERRVADLQTKNLSLFVTGNEILSRYADFGLGTAISAKEPFVSLTRTKLENLVQDFQDQLLDQREKQ